MAGPDDKPPRLLTGCIAGVDIPVSRLIYGTLFLGNLPESEAMALLDAVWMSGCNAFDCAAIYGGGQCERRLGDWLRSRGIKRELVVLISKGGCHGQDKLWSASLAEHELLEADLEGSISRLGVTYLDVYLLHRDDPQIAVGSIVTRMNSLIDGGRIRTWGVSNWSIARIAAARKYALDNHLTPPCCDSCQSSLAEPRGSVWPGTTFITAETRTTWLHAAGRQPHLAGGVSLLGWECLAKGFMAGKWGHHDAIDEAPLVPAQDDPAAAAKWRDVQLRYAYCTPTNFARRERAIQLAQSHGVALPTLAIGYVLSQPSNDFALIGTTTASHFQQAVDGACSTSRVARLTEGELAFLEHGATLQVRATPLTEDVLSNAMPSHRPQPHGTPSFSSPPSFG